MIESINPRVKFVFDNFIDRAASVKDSESEHVFNDGLEGYASDIERDLGDKLTAVDCEVLYSTFDFLKELAARWRI